MVSNVITAMTSNQMVAPNVWIDPRNGNNYFLAVQYPKSKMQSLADLRSIPLHGVAGRNRRVSICSVQSREHRRPPKWTITRSGGRSISMYGQAARIWAASPTASRS